VTKTTNKKQIIQEFLKTNEIFIDYNGSEYTMVNKDNKLVNICNSTEEVLQYILGFNSAIEISRQKIQFFEKTNKDNIERYERIIADIDKESFLDDTDYISELSEKIDNNL